MNKIWVNNLREHGAKGYNYIHGHELDGYLKNKDSQVCSIFPEGKIIVPKSEI